MLAFGRLASATAVVAARRCYSTAAAAAAGAEFSHERLTGTDEGIIVFTMNRPAAKNALGKDMMRQLRESMDRVRNDKSVRVVVLRSVVEGVFCAGADLKERLQMTESEVADFVYGIRDTFSLLETLPMPTIAALDGAALGGGLEMAMSCDLRVASESAKLGLPEARLAIIPGAGGTQRLPRIIGRAKAKELIFTSKIIDGKRAEEIGLVNFCVKGSAYERSLSLAREMLPNGPIALRMAKFAIDKGVEADRATGMAIEQSCYAQIIPTQDRIEGLKAFREKRTPVYKGC
eukprot:Opistho-1_new@52242